MPDLLKWSEDTPATAPAVPTGLSPAAAALDPLAVWSRLELWSGHRWEVRDFEAVIEGPGEWSAPVAPVTYAAADVWAVDTWAVSELRPGPLGLVFACGTFRISGTVGDGQPADPDALEAYRRYAEFLAETGKRPGYQSWNFSLDGAMSISWRRERNAMAKGIYGSGAADMLRKYRKAR